MTVRTNAGLKLFMQSTLANAVTISSITKAAPASSPPPAPTASPTAMSSSSAPRAWSN